MTVIYKSSDYYLIDHREFISNVYKNVNNSETGTSSYSMLAKLFSIIDYKQEQNRKRTHNADNYHEEVRPILTII